MQHNLIKYHKTVFFKKNSADLSQFLKIVSYKVLINNILCDFC